MSYNFNPSYFSTLRSLILCNFVAMKYKLLEKLVTRLKSGRTDPTYFETYRWVSILILDFEKLHGSYHSLHGHKYVLKDQLDESSFVFIRITGSVNDAHLFNEGRFPGFSRTCIIQKSFKKILFQKVALSSYVCSSAGPIIY